MSKAACGSEKAVTRFETRNCKCVCKMPYMVDESGACANKVNMTKIVDYAPGHNLKEDMTINQGFYSKFVPKENGGTEDKEAMQEMKTALS